jgi:hypothetical protein
VGAFISPQNPLFAYRAPYNVRIPPFQKNEVTMPRPKKSALLARISGADLNHPARYKSASMAPTSVTLIGGPPSWLDAAQGMAWNELRDTLPWIEKAHTGIVGIASVLLAKLHAGTANMSEMNLLRLCLGQLGATPADARRVSMPEADKAGDDPAEQCFS